MPALTAPAAIRSWQGTDPFYAYVPFQATAVGVDDSAATWLGVVKTATGGDLAALADSEAAPGGSVRGAPRRRRELVRARRCDAEHARDVVKRPGPSRDGAARARDRPAERADRPHNTVGADSAAQIAALSSEVADLKLALRDLKLTRPATIPSRAALITRGISVTVAGPAQRTVRTRLKISEVAAGKLRLRSRILASRRVTLDAAGSASVTLKPTKAAATGLKKAKTALEVAADATAGDRYYIVSARLRG